MSNDIKLFAGSASDTYTPAAWAALTTLLTNGFVTGVASTTQINTLMRQLSTVAAAIGQFMSNQGTNAVDDGNLTNFTTALTTALDSRYAGQSVVGSVSLMAGTTVPANCLKLNGAILSRTTYSTLYSWAASSGNIVSEATWSATNPGSFSSGDGSSTFRLPNFLGVFIRMWHDGNSIDPDYLTRTFGMFQGSQNLSHSHVVPQGANFGAGPQFQGNTSYTNSDYSTNTSGGSEARPINLPLLPVIRYK